MHMHTGRAAAKNGGEKLLELPWPGSKTLLTSNRKVCVWGGGRGRIKRSECQAELGKIPALSWCRLANLTAGNDLNQEEAWPSAWNRTPGFRQGTRVEQRGTESPDSCLFSQPWEGVWSEGAGEEGIFLP